MYSVKVEHHQGDNMGLNITANHFQIADLGQGCSSIYKQSA